MTITLNGLVINDPTNGNGIYLDEPIDGLDLPPLRTSSGSYSGRDGGWVGAQFYASRLLSLTGRVFSSNVATLYASRKTLQSSLAQPAVTVLVSTDDGGQYRLDCTLDSFDMPIKRAKSRADFHITLLNADAIIYDTSAGGADTASIARTSGGGLSWPLTWPLTWSAGSAPTTVTNNGTVTIFPTVTLTGVMTSPVLTNNTTGQFISLPTFTTAAGDVLKIDMLNRTVLLNGGSVLPAVVTSSSWWPLIPGSNSISLATGSSSDTVTGTVTWRSGIRGI